MHTPDGFLHPWMAGAFILLTGAVLAVAAMRARDSLTEYRIQLFAIVAAAVFAAQMLNYEYVRPCQRDRGELVVSDTSNDGLWAVRTSMCFFHSSPLCLVPGQ